MISMFNEDGAYEGGSYFDFRLDEDTEYWECDDCYFGTGSDR